MKITIVGHGHVGKAIKETFSDSFIYDPYQGFSDKTVLEDIDICFVAVPTPSLPDGGCDISIVESVIKSIDAKIIVIRSTVKVGTTKYLNDKYHKNIVFSPEFIGITKEHPYKTDKDIPYVIIGKEDNNDISLLLSLYNHTPVHVVKSKEAEMAKYMLNAFLASKVMFANEINDLCNKTNIDYNQVKDIVLLDPRVGKTHLNVDNNNPGFGGPCLPKDIKALEKMMEECNSHHDLISAVIKENNKTK